MYWQDKVSNMSLTFYETSSWADCIQWWLNKFTQRGPINGLMSTLIGCSGIIEQPLHLAFDIPFLFIGEMNYNWEGMVIKFLPCYKIAVSFLPACMLTIHSDCWNVISFCVCLISMYSLFKVEVNQFFWRTMSNVPFSHIDMYIHIDISMCMHTCPSLLGQLLCLWFSYSPKLPIS